LYQTLGRADQTISRLTFSTHCIFHRRFLTANQSQCGEGSHQANVKHFFTITCARYIQTLSLTMCWGFCIFVVHNNSSRFECQQHGRRNFRFHARHFKACFAAHKLFSTLFRAFSFQKIEYGEQSWRIFEDVVLINFYAFLVVFTVREIWLCLNVMTDFWYAMKNL